MIYPKLWYCT